MNIRVILSCIVLAIAAEVSFADPLEGLTVYRGVDGELSSASRRNLVALKSAAARQGEISVWVGFNMTIEANPELRTTETAAEEARVKQGLIEKVIAPIVASGQADELVQLPEFSGAPGVMLSVTAAGLSHLVGSRDIKFIGYMNYQ